MSDSGNLVGVRIEITDDSSGAIRARKELDATAAATQRANAATKKYSQSMLDEANGTKLAAERHKAFRSALGDTNNALNRASGSVQGLATRVGRDLVLAFAVSGAAMVGWGLKAANQFQQTQVAFEGLLGSAAKGNKLFADLAAYNKKTPFNIQDLTQVSRLLLGFQFKEGQIMPLTKSIADSSAALGAGSEGLQRIALNLGQIQSIGKVTGRDLRDLATVGFPGYALVGDILGKTKEQVSAMGDGVKVSSDQFIQAVINMQGPLSRFTGMAEKQMHTIFGLASNVKDSFTYALVGIPGQGSGQAPMQKLVDQLMPLFEGQNSPVTQALTGLVGAVGPGLADITATLTKFMIAAGPGIGQIFGALANGFSMFLTAITTAGSGGAVDAIVKSIGMFFTALAPMAPQIIELLVRMVELLPRMLPLIDAMLRIATALLSWGPASEVVAVLLTGLLAYSKLSGLFSIFSTLTTLIRGTASAMGGVASSSATAQSSITSFGTNAVKTIGAIGLAAATVAYDMYVSNAAQAAGKENAKTGKKPSFGNFLLHTLPAAIPSAAAGFLVGGPIGAAVGGTTGAISAGYTYQQSYKTGQGMGDVATSSAALAGHNAANKGVGGSRQITSGLRNFGLASAHSGHADGRAIDVAGSNLYGYRDSVRKRGGFAVVHNAGNGQHAHAEFGDVAGGTTTMSGGGGDYMHVDIHGNNFSSNIDVEQAVREGINKAKRDDKARFTGWRNNK